VAKLDISVTVLDGQTVSWFALPRKGRIVFHNDATENLHVTIQSPALCQSGNQPVLDFDVVAGDSQGFHVCGPYQGDRFKYTATVQNAATEDPRIIIKDHGPVAGDVSLGTAVVVAALTASIGAAVGALVTRRSYARGLSTK
jgi:hypothetical protein